MDQTALQLHLRGTFTRRRSTSTPTSRGVRPAPGAWGVLCDLHPRFMPVNDWNTAFAVVYYHDDGTFQVQNLKLWTGWWFEWGSSEGLGAQSGLRGGGL